MKHREFVPFEKPYPESTHISVGFRSIAEDVNIPVMTVLKLDLAAKPGQAHERALGIERKAGLVTLAYNLRPGARQPRLLSVFDMGGHRGIEYRAALFMLARSLWGGGKL